MNRWLWPTAAALVVAAALFGWWALTGPRGPTAAELYALEQQNQARRAEAREVRLREELAAAGFRVTAVDSSESNQWHWGVKAEKGECRFDGTFFLDGPYAGRTDREEGLRGPSHLVRVTSAEHPVWGVRETAFTGVAGLGVWRVSSHEGVGSPAHLQPDAALFADVVWRVYADRVRRP